jgi:hypothetical protein
MSIGQRVIMSIGQRVFTLTFADSIYNFNNRGVYLTKKGAVNALAKQIESDIGCHVCYECEDIESCDCECPKTMKELKKYIKDNDGVYDVEWYCGNYEIEEAYIKL